jgi:hypothetical protein
MQVPDIFATLKQFIPHLTWGSAILGIATFLWALIKGVNHATTKGNQVAEEWNQMRSKIDECSDQLTLAMTNHLPHIEQASERSAAAGERTAEAIQDQAVILGKILAVLETQQRLERP